MFHQLPLNLLRRISITAGDDPCWEMRGALNSGGYTQTFHQGRVQGSHRIAWEYNNGPIPQGMFVCHRCDNKICMNPDHLFLGTASENWFDMIHKGKKPLRDSRGSRNSHARLTEEQVHEIRKRRTDGETYASICAAYKITPGHVKLICNRRIWKHI